MQQGVDITRSIKGGDYIRPCNLLIIQTYHHSQAVVQVIVLRQQLMTITTVTETQRDVHRIIIVEIALNIKVPLLVLIIVMLVVVAEAQNTLVSIIPADSKGIIPMLMEEPVVAIMKPIDLIK